MLLDWILNVYVELRVRYENVFLGGYFTRVKWFPFGLLLKIGRLGVDIGHEADTLRYIRHNTSIPVPRVLVSTTYRNDAYTLMEKVEGMPLESVWPYLDDSERTLVISQIADYVKQLRQLPRSPQVGPGMICSLRGGPLLDSRVSCYHKIGPFSSEAGFNDSLVEAANRFLDHESTSDVRRRMRDDHVIVFTHGDLVPRNIIMRDKRIVAAVDWEESGWMPEHWELVKAKWSSGMEKDSGWDDALRMIFHTGHERDWMIDKELSDRMVGVF